jgi:hypothetical protein
MGGGGSSSSQVDYPPYMKALHSELMWGYDIMGGNQLALYAKSPDEKSMMGALYSALSGVSPYFNYSAHNPQAAFDNVVTAMDAFDDEIAAPAIYDAADAPYLRVLSRFAGQFAMANAVNTSAFVLGIVLLESERLAQMQKIRSDMCFKSAQLRMDYAKAWTIASVDYVQQQVDLAVNDAMFKINLFVIPANVLGSIGGSSGVTTDMTRNRFASGLSGMASGAAIGMSAGGPVGAGIGGLLGLGAGLFG